MGISFAAMISMLTVQQKEAKAIYQQLARGSLKYTILQVLRNPANCTCQFNTLPSFPHTIDTTQTALGGGGYEIDLGEFRSGCVVDPDNIIVTTEKKIKGGAGLVANTVKVSEIKETGSPDEFLGELTIQFHKDNLVRHLKPLTIPLMFIVDSTSGLANARPIKNCGVYELNSGFSTQVAGFAEDLEILQTTVNGLAGLPGRVTTLERRIAALEQRPPSTSRPPSDFGVGCTVGEVSTSTACTASSSTWSQCMDICGGQRYKTCSGRNSVGRNIKRVRTCTLVGAGPRAKWVVQRTDIGKCWKKNYICESTNPGR